MKKNKILLLTLTFVLVLSTMGCTTRQMRTRTQTRIGTEVPGRTVRRDNIVMPKTRTDLTDRTPTPNLRTDITEMNTAMDSTLITRAKTIAQRVADLNGVDRASTIITGNTALVGVDMKDNIKGKMTTDLKQRIETRVKNTDTRIKNVSVTADPDLATRIRTIASDIENGRPITGFADEIKEILRKITPIK